MHSVHMLLASSLALLSFRALHSRLQVAAAEATAVDATQKADPETESCAERCLALACPYALYPGMSEAACISVTLPVCLSVCLIICASSICVSAHLSVCPPVCLSISLSVCLPQAPRIACTCAQLRNGVQGAACSPASMIVGSSGIYCGSISMHGCIVTCCRLPCNT